MKRASFDELARGVLKLQERIDFKAHLWITGASFFQEGGPLCPLSLESRFDDFSDLLLPANHQAAWRVRQRSQIFAKLQSRATVFAETLSTSAISRASSPPKNLSSTTSLSRGCELAKVFSASSRARRSGARS